MTTDERLDRIDQYLQAFRAEVSLRFQVLENRMDVMNASIQAIQILIPSTTKALADYGAAMTAVLKQLTQLNERIHALEETRH